MALIEVAATAAEAKALYDQARREGWQEKFIANFRRRTGLLLVGPSGTGKSNFLKALKTDFPEAIDLINRTVVVEKSRLKLGRYPFVVRDTPGDAAKTRERQRAYADHMRRNHRGVVNVVSYGYHEYPKAVPSAVVGGKVVPKFLKDHRAEELRSLGEWGSYLDPKGERFILTVVTKADIWWRNRARVLSHYESGPYAKTLTDLGWTTNHVVVPYSSVSHRFFNQVDVSGEFDDAVRAVLKSHVLGSMVSLAAAD